MTHDGHGWRTAAKHALRTVTAVVAALLHWPREEARRLDLRAAGCARLLLVPPGAPIPDLEDDLEDWVRVPADELELHRRLCRLDAIAAAAAVAIALVGVGVADLAAHDLDDLARPVAGRDRG